MNEFIEKLIGRLESRKEKVLPKENYLFGNIGLASTEGFNRGIKTAISIVNQLAEEYKLKTNANMKEVIDNLEVYTVGRLNTSKVDISVLQLQRYINRLKQIAEEYNGGWIPYATGAELPLNNQKVWLSFTSQYTSFVKSAWWVNDHFEWNNGRTVKDVPLAWKPYNVPAPYQPKGE